MATDDTLAEVRQAAESGKITHTAAKNIKAWLTEPRYADYAPEVARMVGEGQWQMLDDVFWTVIPFGTGGRRGRMFPVGSNAINDRTIGESAQGLAEYVKSQLGDGAELSCAIAYDTRHRSEHFARLCAEIMVASGFRVYFLQGFRSTPELSFCVRSKHCSCGIMVTASHNPPSDNAVKAYWSTGGQLVPPDDKGVIDCVMAVGHIDRSPFDAALAEGQIVACQDEVDPQFIAAVASVSVAGPRDVKVLYSPLHGVGATAVIPVLEKVGFAQVEVFSQHAKPDGDFPNVPGHVANPETAGSFRLDHRPRQPRGLRSGDCDGPRLRPHRLRGAAYRQSRRSVAHAVRQSNRRPAGRLCARIAQGGWEAHAAAFHCRDAGHDAAHAPHRRQLRRAHRRRSVGGFQVDCRGHRRIWTGVVCVRHRGIARLHGRDVRSRQRRRRRVNAPVRAGREIEIPG